jgi:hypothetical protein
MSDPKTRGDSLLLPVGARGSTRAVFVPLIISLQAKKGPRPAPTIITHVRVIWTQQNRHVIEFNTFFKLPF